MTELGVTTETLAKWHELDALLDRRFGLHISPEIADAFGLKILAVGARRRRHRLSCSTAAVEDA